MTRSTPSGTRSIRLAARALRRRLTRLRITALPTDPGTTKPTRGARIARESVTEACTTSRRDPARARQWPRVTSWKSAPVRNRCRCGNTSSLASWASAGQADSSTRPFRRRAARMARPARVLMRWRKPWFLARRRLFGWNVRLLTMLAFVGSSQARQHGQQMVWRSTAVLRLASLCRTGRDRQATLSAR